MFSRNFWGISKLRETNFTKFWEGIYDIWCCFIMCIQIKVSAWVCILGVAREREPRCFLLLLSKLSTQSLETLGIYIYLSIVWCKKKLYNSACIFYNHPSKFREIRFWNWRKILRKCIFFSASDDTIINLSKCFIRCYMRKCMINVIIMQ